ncbi:SDR family oxidoreductase [Parendozoicomonas haliclonae]|uniref:C-factor n=1 Tax=Parendozoicomonas haliclonae TaxID=1960125 RepID=A0A1X7AQ72_9GAMM|nr:SDR family oxidoreductase [Parendozoicomonas haliclonae]SMA50248.1 C-factor [Parendozoicomonas haliclonae]
MKEVLIIGGCGGIGSALVDSFLAPEEPCQVHATWCHQRPTKQHERLKWYLADVTDEAAIEKLSGQFEHLDYLINAVGVLHNGMGEPEKNISQVKPEFFLMNLSFNAMPTLLLAKHFKKVLKPVKNSVFATISAKVGSIEDNRLGGWYSYRASKAALNMVLKNLSIEWQRELPECCVAALHPGTTDTALSKPFQARVPADKLFSPATSAHCLTTVLSKLTPKDSGRFWSWDGSQLPW